MGRRCLAVDRDRRGELARLADVVDRAAEGGRRISKPSPPTSSAPASRDVLLLGMGGSSLGPEVLAQTFGAKPGFPRLHVLDSTDPAQIRRIESSDRPRSARCSSCRANRAARSNPTSSSNISTSARKAAVGEAEAAKHFVAITDPGSSLEKIAARRGLPPRLPRRAEIGGRYSVLSDFGMVPAAAIGIDVARLPRTHRRDGALLRRRARRRSRTRA